jgi:hypothetical protein
MIIAEPFVARGAMVPMRLRLEAQDERPRAAAASVQPSGRMNSTMNHFLSENSARTAPASSNPSARSNDLSASRCEKTARNYGAFVALAHQIRQQG